MDSHIILFDVDFQVKKISNNVAHSMQNIIKTFKIFLLFQCIWCLLLGVSIFLVDPLILNWKDCRKDERQIEPKVHTI